MYLPTNLKFLMSAHKVSGKELAKEMGWNDAVISSYRTGGADPPLKNVIKLADYFNVSLEDLVNKDLSKEGVEYKTGDNDDLIIELLMKEVKHLRRQISKNGGDETAADAAIEKAVKTLRKAEGKNKE
jgi:transcriptional regulator with XRE-family HTH domain